MFKNPFILPHSRRTNMFKYLLNLAPCCVVVLTINIHKCIINVSTNGFLHAYKYICVHICTLYIYVIRNYYILSLIRVSLIKFYIKIYIYIYLSYVNEYFSFPFSLTLNSNIVGFFIN